MAIRRDVIAAVLVTFCLTAALFAAVPTLSQPAAPEYNPWADLNDDGIIDIFDVVAVTGIYEATGTPTAKASIAFDSGWIDITDKCGQVVTVAHNLNSTDIMVDITGKAKLDGSPHQIYIGLGGYTTGWQRTYGGTITDGANSVVQTVDGGYALAGYTNSFGAGNQDSYLARTDAGGSLQWNKTYGGTGADAAYSMVQTADGGYALAGYTWSFGAGVTDVYLVKTDAAGNLQWNKTYGGIGGDIARSVVQTADGGYALTGETWSFGVVGSDVYLVKTDAGGSLQWNKTYGGAGIDCAFSVVQTVDGGYALAGYTSSFGAGGYDVYLVKTDAAGNLQWNKTYGGAGTDAAYSMVQTADGGYTLAGYTGSFGVVGPDFYLVKTDASGNLQWNKTYGGAGTDYAYSVVRTADGGYALAGSTSSFGAGNYDFYLVKTDAAGNLQWNKTYGGIGDDVANCLVRTVDEGYALAGYTWSFGAGGSDFYLVKTDAESGLCWSSSTLDSIRLYRGITDQYWNYVRVRIWKIKEAP